MNIQNMHIAVRQGVDKINSLQADSLLSEELDLELNKSMGRFINLKYGKNNQYGKGFEESQKRIDDLSTLVEEHRGYTGFVDREMLGYYKNKFLFKDCYYLPFNYMHHIESSCNSSRTPNCDLKSFRLEYYHDADYDVNKDYEEDAKFFVLPWSSLQPGAVNVNSKILIERGVELNWDAYTDQDMGIVDSWESGGGALQTVLWEYNAGDGVLDINGDGYIVNSEGIYKNYLIEHILNNHSDDVIIKWEKSGTEFYSDSFIIIVKPGSNLGTWVRTEAEAESIMDTLDASVYGGFNADGELSTSASPTYDSSDSFTSIISAKPDTSMSTGTFSESRLVKLMSSAELVGYKRKFTLDTATQNSNAGNSGGYWDNVEGIGRKWEGVNTPIKYVQHDDLHALLKDPFNRPGTNSVFGIFVNSKIELYTLSDDPSSSSIIPDSVKLKYLRNPLPMSLGLGINCELPQHTHEEIVAMTISSILEGISDPRYKTHMNELIRQE